MPKSRNITRTKKLMSTVAREKALGQKGFVIWLTGLSGSGKSTIAWKLDSELFRIGRHAYVLDGDNLRHGLNSDLGFSDADRNENIRRAGEVAALFADASVIAVAAFISPFRKDRMNARKAAGKGRFVEVHLCPSLETCISRDPKGLYRKAMKGQIRDFTGISSPYEEPHRPEIRLDTSRVKPDECVKTIIAHLRRKKLI